MKITRIKAICKTEKHCIIYEQGESRRLIGTRNAAYPADELNISRYSLKTLFDWPDVLNDIGVETVALEETRMHPMSEWHQHLVELTPCWTVAYAGEAIIPLMYKNGLLFVREAYISAAEKIEGYTHYYLSENAMGEPLVVISDGLIATAIVKPLPVNTAKGICTYMAELCRTNVQGWPDQEGIVDDNSLDKQIAMDEMLEEAKSDDGE